METLYRVGDQVRIRKDIKIGNYYLDDNSDYVRCIGGMLPLAGKIATIRDIDSSGRYTFKEHPYCWVPSMVSSLDEETWCYKPGDKVIVRADLVPEVFYYSDDGTDCNDVIPEMLEFLGEEVTIKTRAENKSYHIEEDNGKWYWTDEMFIPCKDIEESDVPIETLLFG